ncbi:hypothetical protein COR50_06535 [Chitinophaga caeni]|uniref:Uncharacterized protein n=1 Tax=Chitinophaga caeni TaxID=2029983 RepID=A0A291QSP1_9BACT|nr:hypothetical protein COR50_06535 [Chitinophaga caeni]
MRVNVWFWGNAFGVGWGMQKSPSLETLPLYLAYTLDLFLAFLISFSHALLFLVDLLFIL